MPTIDNKECQWENCSGGQYCEKHSLESTPEKKERPMTEGEAEIARDLDKFMSTPSWEERFDELRIKGIIVGEVDADGDYDYNIHEESPDFIKSFIKEEREKAYERGRNSIKEIVKDVEAQYEHEVHGLKGVDGFNIALNHILQALEDGKNNIK